MTYQLNYLQRGAIVSIPRKGLVLLKPRGLKTLVVFSFQGAVPRTLHDDSKFNHKKQPQIAKTLTVKGARMIFS